MSCPICHKSENEVIYRLCDNMKIMGPGFPDTPSFVVKCSNCGLLYMQTEATQNNFLNYYQHGAVAPKYYDMFGKKDTDEYYHHLIELMKPYIEKNSSMLDIAGAWGEFAAYLKELGYENITVMDPNESCISYAESIGIKTVKSDSTDMTGIKDNSIDMVILNHTLEHVLDVENTMLNIHNKLKKEGYLFIEVPDVEGYVGEESAPFNFLTYEHVLHMSMNDIENLAALYGFEIIEKGTYYKKVSNYPSIYAVMRKGEKRDLVYSENAGMAMMDYIEKSKKSIEQFLEPLRESGEELILWGIGASTAILIESFVGCNVKSLIDRNPARQGLVFSVNGRRYVVQSPEEAGEGTIVILSIPYHDSIMRQIRQMGYDNKIVALK